MWISSLRWIETCFHKSFMFRLLQSDRKIVHRKETYFGKQAQSICGTKNLVYTKIGLKRSWIWTILETTRCSGKKKREGCCDGRWCVCFIERSFSDHTCTEKKGSSASKIAQSVLFLQSRIPGGLTLSLSPSSKPLLVHFQSSAKRRNVFFFWDCKANEGDEET